MELETDMAIVIDEADSYLIPQIVTGKDSLVFHSEWDNLNEVLTNVTGPNVVNTAAGIMLQKQKKEKRLQLSNHDQCWIDKKSEV